VEVRLEEAELADRMVEAPAVPWVVLRQQELVCRRAEGDEVFIQSDRLAPAEKGVTNGMAYALPGR
jgi:hypothetical protein